MLLLLFSFQPLTKSQPIAARPKIGLALSGGGALGMAHIGTLKVMEEAGLRPDYITGVSMGSIIGGLYALGYSADSLEKMFKRADWNLILSNNIPENKVIFTEKGFFNNSIMALPVTFRKFQLPGGLIRGQLIESMLSYYAWPAADINDFSKFPIPFMCLGTDLVSCKKVDLRKGYLPDAIRASMAVPSIFTPVSIDTAIIIDGGFVRNIAVSELKEMGADIIIGSYTGFQRIKEDELQSVSGVLKQLSFFNSYIDYTEEKKLVDYLIEPNVKDLSATSFGNVDTVIQRGYKAAMPLKAQFKKLADSLDRIAPQKPIQNILNKKTFVFDRIDVKGNEINSDVQILGVLNLHPHERINKQELTDKIELLYGRSWFEKVQYRVVPKEDSLILVIDCVEKPKTMLYGSVHYDNSLRAGLIIGLSAKNPLFEGSMVDINTFIGQYYRYRAAYTQFVDKNQLFGLSVNFDGDFTQLPMMILRNQAGEVNMLHIVSGLSLNKRIGLNHMMTISAKYENLTLTPDYIDAEKLKRLGYDYLTLNYRNELNTYDTKYFPKKGTLVRVAVNTSKLISGVIKTQNYREEFDRVFPGDFSFKRNYSITGNVRQCISASSNFVFNLGGDVLFTYSADTSISPLNYFYIGGQDFTTEKSIPLTGFHSNEIPVEKMVRLALDADLSISDKLHLGFLTNICLAQEVSPDKKWSILGGFGVNAGYMSFIGPVKIGIMQGFSSVERYFSGFKGYISLGYNF
jgi:NTE family protein